MFPEKQARVVHLKFRVNKRERSGIVEHLCLFQDERTECIYVPENTAKLAEYRACTAFNPGKKGPDIIECIKEWVKSDLIFSVGDAKARGSESSIMRVM